MAASRRAKALGVETKSVRMPRCNKQGGFEEVQCDNEIVSSCWCVDASGFELPGTRAPAASLVNCTGKYRVFVYKVPIQIGMVCLEIRRHSQAHKMIEWTLFCRVPYVCKRRNHFHVQKKKMMIHYWVHVGGRTRINKHGRCYLLCCRGLWAPGNQGI